MGVLIVLEVAFSLLIQAGILLYLTRLEKTLLDLMDGQTDLGNAVETQFKRLKDQAIPPAKVTDPFSRRKQIFSSTSHIVVPKTPTEIRNQNFERIKNGESYGSVD